MYAAFLYAGLFVAVFPFDVLAYVGCNYDECKRVMVDLLRTREIVSHGNS